MKNLYTFAIFALLLALGAQPMIAQMGHFPPDPMQLMFVSQPPGFARIGVPYVYTAIARSKDSSAVIRYMSDMRNPQGFSIDSVTGVVTWTPLSRGWYPIAILARSDKGELGVQRFAVTVTNGNGVVQGKVQDTTGTGIPHVVVEVVQASNIDPMHPGCFSFATRTDSIGNYRIANIEPGMYKVHAISPTPLYASQWYDGKATPDEANRITIPDSPSVTVANFTLRAGEMQLPHFAVSGTVTDTASNPIKNAFVGLVRSGFALNSNEGVEDFRNMFDNEGPDNEGPGMDFRMEGFSPHAFHSITDSLGHYSLKLPPGVYIAFAHAPGYAKEFYLHQSNMLTADKLSLTSDTTGIDFTLAQLPPVAYGTIQGAVLDTLKGIGVRSRVVAMRDRWTVVDPYPVCRSYTVDTDSLGAYTLDNLLPGAYIVFALPVGNYAPAFYTDDTTGTGWHKATRVLINGNTVSGINIYVREISHGLHGFTGISGTITLDAAPPFTAAGTMVYATANSAIAGYGIADPTGHYVIDGLAPGTYAVNADLPGTDAPQSGSATVSYSASGAPLRAVVNLTLSVTTGVADAGTTQPEAFSLAQNYPNPFNPSTVISYQLASAGRVDLRVFDVLGREVAVLVSGAQSSGTHSVNFNGSALASGVYLYRLSIGSTTITKKMLLMK